MEDNGLCTPSVDAKINQYLRENVTSKGVAPCAVAGYAKRLNDQWTLVLGAADESYSRVFDLASISKTFTALTAASLVDQGSLHWTQALEELLPEVRGTWGGRRSVVEHLCHRSGLVAHREFFRRSWQGYPVHIPTLLKQMANERGDQPAGAAVYSDLGYILVGKALERHTQTPLDWLIFERICGPWALRIGSARSFVAHLYDSPAQIAATELQPRRGGQLAGLVHDDNAWALSGFGASGHAGLFGDAQSVLRLGCHLLDQLESPLLAPLLQVRGEGSLRLGLDTKSGEHSAAGQVAGSRTFGHLGFTGTSFWCDPDRSRVTVLLTNRVNPTRDNPKLRPLRSKIHDFLWEC